MSYRVYFGRLPDTLEQDAFEKLLEEHGKARNIEWKTGYAYVDYKHGSDASKTVQNLNGREIDGNNILVELAQNGAGGYSVAGGFSARQNKPLPRPTRTPHRARIENLSSRAKWMELKELLSLAGEVMFADTHKRKQGEGIVEFSSKRDLEEAIKMFDKTSFFGRMIRLYDESPRNRADNRRDSRSPPRRRSSPSHNDRKSRRSRSRSKSPDRKVSHSERRYEGARKRRSKSPSPRRKSEKQRYSKSPSPTRHTSSTRRRDRSKTPTKSSRNSHKKSKKSRKDASRSRSKSPSRKRKEKKNDVKRKHKQSPSSSENENDIKMKVKMESPNKNENDIKMKVETESPNKNENDIKMKVETESPNKNENDIKIKLETESPNKKQSSCSESDSGSSHNEDSKQKCE